MACITVEIGLGRMCIVRLAICSNLTLSGMWQVHFSACGVPIQSVGLIMLLINTNRVGFVTFLSSNNLRIWCGCSIPRILFSIIAA